MSVRRGGKRVWRGKCLSDPTAIAALIRKHAPSVERVVFETGSSVPVHQLVRPRLELGKI